MFGLALIALGALLPTDPGFFPIEMAAAAPAELTLPPLVSSQARAVASQLRAALLAGPQPDACASFPLRPLPPLPRCACCSPPPGILCVPAMACYPPRHILLSTQGYDYDALEPHIDEATMVSKEQRTDPARSPAGAAPARPAAADAGQPGNGGDCMLRTPLPGRVLGGAAARAALRAMRQQARSRHRSSAGCGIVLSGRGLSALTRASPPLLLVRPFLPQRVHHLGHHAGEACRGAWAAKRSCVSSVSASASSSHSRPPNAVELPCRHRRLHCQDQRCYGQAR